MYWDIPVVDTPGVDEPWWRSRRWRTVVEIPASTKLLAVCMTVHTSGAASAIDTSVVTAPAGPET
jgi:hypothetical protein